MAVNLINNSNPIDLNYQNESKSGYDVFIPEYLDDNQPEYTLEKFKKNNPSLFLPSMLEYVSDDVKKVMIMYNYFFKKENRIYNYKEFNSIIERMFVRFCIVKYYGENNLRHSILMSQHEVNKINDSNKGIASVMRCLDLVFREDFVYFIKAANEKSVSTFL